VNSATGLRSRGVRVEQARSGVAVDDETELPGEIVRIVNAGIAAETTVRRHEMRGVADDEDPPILKPLRHGRRCAPARETVDSDLEIRHTDRGPHQLEQAGLAHVRGRIGRGARIKFEISNRIDAEEARRRGAIHSEKSAQLRIVDVNDAPGILADPRR
jgi:hypothetical protein